MTIQPALADLTDLLHAAQNVVAGADEILITGYGNVTASQKADGSLVTRIDRAADDYFTTQLTARFPDHAVLSEERNTHYDPTIGFTWVIDPLDGTTNFARGLPIWGVSVALLCNGMLLLGVLSFVLLREQYAGVKGKGAHCNGQALHTAPTQQADDQHFLMQCTRTPQRYRVTSPLKPRILGSAAYHIATVANGSALAGIEATPKIWDIAAALLILEEAGGTYRALGQTSPIFPLAQYALDYERCSYPLVVAANNALLVELEANIEKS